jgi:hypothetical protein
MGVPCKIVGGGVALRDAGVCERERDSVGVHVTVGLREDVWLRLRVSAGLRLTVRKPVPECNGVAKRVDVPTGVPAGSLERDGVPVPAGVGVGARVALLPVEEGGKMAVRDEVGRGRQAAYCGALHSPGCSTPLTQHAQQKDAEASPAHGEQSNDCAPPGTRHRRSRRSHADLAIVGPLQA